MRRYHTTWVGIGVTGDELEAVVHFLLGHFHGAPRSAFEVYNAWSLVSEHNELYLSPMAFAALAAMRPARYRVLGAMATLPPSCDLLMGDQTRRPCTCIDLPTFFHAEPAEHERKPG